MTVTTTLKLKMGTLSGEKTFSFKYINPNITAAQVKTLAQALIANGEIYKYPPQVLSKATFEQVETTVIDID